MATNFGAIFADQPSIDTVALRNGLKYRNIDEQISSAIRPIPQHRVQIW